MIQNHCAFVASTQEELKIELQKALMDEKTRQDVVNAAQLTRERYFKQK